jgi:endonuclease-3
MLPQSWWRRLAGGGSVMSPSDLRGLALEVNRRLLVFFGRPVWRTPLPPLDELVSTILSQNTNDRNRDAAFQSLRRHFPTWEEVRDAEPEAVVSAIRSAGLANQKAPRIQAVLSQISQERGGLDLSFLQGLQPQEAHDWLIRFKGVGPKTAAIVLLFSLGMPAFPVDTHIYRVSGRIGLRPSKLSVEKAHEYLARLFPAQEYESAHLNLIRLGRTLCLARRPQCTLCPLKDVCEFGKRQ